MIKGTPPWVTLIICCFLFLGFTHILLSESNLSITSHTFISESDTGFSRNQPTAKNEPAKENITFQNPSKQNENSDSKPVIVDEVLPATCADAHDGAIEITVSNGNPPYTYSWSNESNYTSALKNITNLAPGTYHVEVTDNFGATTTLNGIVVNFVDDIIPNVVTRNLSVELDTNGNAFISASEIDNGSSDTCGIASISLNQESFDCSHVGNNTVTLTVTDNNGNSNSATATVNVEDNVAPVVNTQNITVQLDANGQASITAADVDNGSIDACGISAMTVSPNTFSCSNVGTNEVTLTVTDTHGNPDTATAIVTVKDTIAPVVHTNNIVVQLDANGSVSIAQDAVNNNSTDTCGELTFSTSKTTFDCTNIGENTVTLTVTDKNGNSATGTAVVTVQDTIIPFIAAVAELNVNTDAGLCSAAVVITAPSVSDNCTAGTITGSRNDNKPLSDPFPLGETLITWRATDVNNNEAETVLQKVIVKDNEGPVVPELNNITWGCAYTVEVPVAIDNCDGEITATANRSTTFTTSGTILWTFTDAANNISTAEQIITITPLSISLQKQDIVCFGAANGSAQVNISGGVAPYTYIWGTGQTGQSISGLAPGDYSVDVTDATGCVISGAVNITQPEKLDATISSTNLSCNGADDGSITFSNPAGGSMNFQYSINGTNWQTGMVFNNLAGGSYSLQIRDTQTQSCVVVLNPEFVIDEPGQLSMSEPTFTQVSCFGGADGTITAGEITGGTAPYEYSVDNINFNTTGEFSGLPADTHTIFVRDTNGCALQRTITVTQSPQLNAGLVKTDVACFGGNSGAITIQNPTGGSGNYEYRIDSGNWQPNLILENLSKGTYAVSMRDKDFPDCEVILSQIQINEPTAALSAEVTSTRTSTHGTSTGSATATPAGGTSPYTYQWRKKDDIEIIQNTQTATNLPAGIYTVTVIDKNNCSVQKDIRVIDKITAEISAPSVCTNVRNEYRTSTFAVDYASILGGVGDPANFIFTWDFGSGVETIVTNGDQHTVNYNTGGDKIITLTIEDEDGFLTPLTFLHYVGECFEGCGSSNNFTIDQNNFYFGDAEGTPIDGENCDATADKYLWINITKSSNVYTITGEIEYNVSDGTATTARKATKCFATLLSGSPGSNNNKPVYKQINTGLFRLFKVEAGATDDATINWSCGEAFNIERINLRYTIQENKECGDNNQNQCIGLTDDIIVSTPIIATAEFENIKCNNTNTGSISINARGGIRPFKYSITGNIAGEYQDSNLFINLEGKTYSNIWVLDSRGQTFQLPAITITEPEILEIESISQTNPVCFGEMGQARVIAKGGTPFSDGEAYQYLWNDSEGQTTALASNLEAGTYTVTVIDANDCQTLETVIITQPEQLSQSNAGPEQSLNCGFTEATLAANTPTVGTGQWTILTGEGGSFTNSSNPNTIFTGVAGREYTLDWTISHEGGGCPNSSETIIKFAGKCDDLDFDGTDDYIKVGDHYGLTTGNFSIEAWVKPNSIQGTRTILSKRNAAALGSGGYDLIINAGSPTFRWGSKSISSSHQISTQRWHHIAVVYREGRLHLYVDGISLVNSVESNPTAISAPFLIGAMHVNNTPEIPRHYFNGWIEEVRIWNTGLTEEQLRFTMNQRIDLDKATLQGSVIPLDVPGDLTKSSLIGYYRLKGDETIDGFTSNHVNNGFNGALRNMTTTQPNTAPLPYQSLAEGSWRERTNWENNAVRAVPNSTGINNAPITWNIAKVNHNMFSGGSDISLLGLLMEEKELKMTGSNADNSGQGLRVSHYLKLKGSIKLQGESQLVQPEGSVLEATDTGYIEKDQQGTASSYNYNYWSSPVIPSGNATASIYTVAGVMMDGTNPLLPKNLNFGNAHTHADGALASPRKISNFWINAFRKKPANQYSAWEPLGSTGTLFPGEGYTMKGTSGESAISELQNYTFKGIPNNGTITLDVDVDQNYLVGNPYPSALDTEEFILDNIKVSNGRNSNNVFNGAVYFWHHFAGKTHILADYVGGYAVRNLIDGVPAYSNDDRIDNSNPEETGNKKPGRYIPVGQGFFINTGGEYENVTLDGGKITFKNSQRSFIKKNETTSQFLRPGEISNSKAKDDKREKLRLVFKSTLGYNRQILVGVDPNTTNGFDLGYDAMLFDHNRDDMYWVQGENDLVIQGVPHFNKDQVLPIGISLSEDSPFTIQIEDLENPSPSREVYLVDKLRDSIHDLIAEAYISTSEPGIFRDRFEIVFFKEPIPEIIPEIPELEGVQISVRHSYSGREIQILNPEEIPIDKMYLFDLNGNNLKHFGEISSEKEVRFPVQNYSSGIYILRVYAQNKIFNKKIIISN